MKRIFSIAIIAMCVLAMSAQTVNQSVKFDETIYDFGTIKETGGKVSHKFKFTNVGKDTVVMTYARSGCVCVSADVPKTSVLPGKSAYVTVTFDPNYRPGHFSKEIAVISNGRKYNRIWVKGDVEPGKHPVTDVAPYAYGQGLYLNFKVMQFGTVASGTAKSMTLVVASDVKKPMEVKFETESNKDYSIIMPESVTLLSQGVAKLEVKAKALRSFKGTVKTKITPIVAGRRLTPIEVQVVGDVK